MMPAAVSGGPAEAAPPWILDARTRFKARLLRARGDDMGELPIALDLSRHDRFAAWALHGWSPPEPHGAWSVGPVAQLLIVPRVPPVAASTAEFEVTAAMAALEPAVQTVDVDINGAVSARWSLRPQAAPGKYALSVPAAALVGLDAYLVTFRIRAPLSPLSLGRSGDARMLGIAIRWITVTPGPPAAPGATRDRDASV